MENMALFNQNKKLGNILDHSVIDGKKVQPDFIKMKLKVSNYEDFSGLDIVQIQNNKGESRDIKVQDIKFDADNYVHILGLL